MNSRQRIDSHQHFWVFDPQKHTWMNEEMAILKRDYLPKNLEPLLHTCGMDGCVAVQASQTEFENDFLLSLSEEYEFIKGIVGWVDLQNKNIVARLAHYSRFSKIKGFRHLIQDEENEEFMMAPSFLNGISSLREFGYTYDVLIYPRHLPNVLKMVQRFPEQLFVIDHLAKPKIGSREISRWKEDLIAVSKNENVFCKISGMVTEASWRDWKTADFIPYIDGVVEAFGMERIMYGSDWPVCTLAATYQEVFDIVHNYFLQFSLTEQDKFFGGNATDFYRL